MYHQEAKLLLNLLGITTKLNMKISASTKGLIIAVLTVLFAFGVYFLFLAKRNYYLVDNPTDNTYYFILNNGRENTITAGQNFKVDLKKGRNRVKVLDDKRNLLYDSAFEVKKDRGLLNIANEDYYINEQFYGYGLNKDSLIAARKATVIDNKNYLNEPKLMNRLYSEDFYYNVDEDYDKVIKNVQKIESRTKIFRKDDFLIYYKEYYNF